jgi:hypothetical protein
MPSRQTIELFPVRTTNRAMLPVLWRTLYQDGGRTPDGAGPQPHLGVAARNAFGEDIDLATPVVGGLKCFHG